MTPEAGPPPTPPPQAPQGLLEKLTREEKIVAGCNLASILLCFMTWWSYTHPVMGMSMQGVGSIPGKLVVLASLVSAGVILGTKADVLKLSEPLPVRIPFYATCAAAAFCLLYLLFGGGGLSGYSAEGFKGAGISMGKTLWPWITLLVSGGGAWIGYQNLTEAAKRAAPPPPVPRED